MNGYSYNGGPYATNGMGQTGNAQDDEMMMLAASGNMGVPSGMGGQSLDDIVSQNAKMIRRQSMPQGYGTSPQHHMDADMRRVSMMDYGNASPAVSGLHYDSNASIDPSGFTSGVTPRPTNHHQAGPSQEPRRPSTADLALNTSFAGSSQPYMPSMAPNSAYATSPAHPSTGLDMSAMESPYMDTSMAMNMDLGVDQSMNTSMGPDPMQMHLYNQPQFNQSSMSSPMHPPQGTPRSGRVSSHDPGGGNSVHNQFGSQNSTPPALNRQMSRPRSLHVPDASPIHSASPLSATPGGLQQGMPAVSRSNSSGFPAQPQNPVPGSAQDRPIGPPPPPSGGFDGGNGVVPVKNAEYNPNNQGFPWEPPDGGWPSTMVGKPHMNSVYKNAYSSTGFDMLGVLVSFRRLSSWCNRN